jgi:hypothetical protein
MNPVSAAMGGAWEWLFKSAPPKDTTRRTSVAPWSFPTIRTPVLRENSIPGVLPLTSWRTLTRLGGANSDLSLPAKSRK